MDHLVLLIFGQGLELPGIPIYEVNEPGGQSIFLKGISLVNRPEFYRIFRGDMQPLMNSLPGLGIQVFQVILFLVFANLAV